ncbi:hypothetical protein ITI46_09225 [Streptomyces oryzae]|uniref:Secreted protein n=1 Tax=Streptomyces oryzae TaxID=1434886 RepID=A0ABS3X8Z2_9ACTN|nr:hypothetical protein [Streptomyces oryzae]MBO8191855.1 hypothetical protein [Streptomyces oryzae]
MVTARSALSMLRVRSHRAGPLRLLWLAVLLLGLLYTHGVSAESAAGHIDPVSVSPAAQMSSGEAEVHGASAEGVPGTSAEHAVEAAGCDEHDGGHETAHPAQDCVSVQPEPAGELPSPCLAPLDAVQSPLLHKALGRPGSAHDVSASPPLTGISSVLRI